MKDAIRQTGRREGRERTGFWGLGSWPGSCGDSSTTMTKTRTLAGLLVLVTVGILAALKASSGETPGSWSGPVDISVTMNRVDSTQRPDLMVCLVDAAGRVQCHHKTGVLAWGASAEGHAVCPGADASSDDGATGIAPAPVEPSARARPCNRRRFGRRPPRGRRCLLFRSVQSSVDSAPTAVAAPRRTSPACQA